MPLLMTMTSRHLDTARKKRDDGIVVEEEKEELRDRKRLQNEEFTLEVVYNFKKSNEQSIVNVFYGTKEIFSSVGRSLSFIDVHEGIRTNSLTGHFAYVTEIHQDMLWMNS
ncbi:hypothetical protein LOAG_08879 [Loa loa]|uniref:Uncharacterized protein n=1 Tax=Loa loa TaxID=7209 RepID=A0A1S0TSP1_LOALO|nr:hypothetical protein LOAG_08879 [Loa loa]EFO19613.1 hypothetical protein LOAG_08879 [Loa loa]